MKSLPLKTGAKPFASCLRRISFASFAGISRMKTFRQRISPPCVCKRILPAFGSGATGFSFAAVEERTPDDRAALETLRTTVEAANRTIMETAAGDEAHDGMGTTVTALSEDNLRTRAREAGISVEEMAAQRNAGIPLGRPNTPEDVAALAVFLASPGARNITGLVDGLR